MTAGGCVILSAAKDLWRTYGESPEENCLTSTAYHDIIISLDMGD
jgi:hypothetical protein